MTTTATSSITFPAELAAIASLFDDVKERHPGLEHDTLSSLARNVRQLQPDLASYLDVEDRLLAPDVWIAAAETGCQACGMQSALLQLAERQARVRELLGRTRSLASRYGTSQDLTPVLRVALWSLMRFGRRLERHVGSANARVMSAARIVNRSIRRA